MTDHPSPGPLAMSTPPHNRRFIAGAVCPRCGALDRIVVDMQTERRECIACDFSEERPRDNPGQELATRVTRAAARRTETPAQAVRLLDPEQKTD